MPFDFEEAIRKLRGISGPLGPSGNDQFGPTPPAPPIFSPGRIDQRMPQSQGVELSPLAQQDPTAPQMPDYAPPEFQNMATTRLMNLIGNMPQRGDSVGKLDRIGGVLAGIGQGPKAQEDFMYRNYNRKLGDWKAQVEPTLQAAQQERAMNTALSTSYTANRRADIQDKRADTYNNRVLSQNEKDRATVDIQRKAQALKETIAGRPDLTWKLDENNEIVGLDNRGGPPVKSGIKSNELSDTQKLQIGLSNALTRITASADAKAGLAGLENELGIKRDAAKITAENAPGNLKPIQPSQQKIENYNRAQQAVNTHPEWRQYIKLGDPAANDFNVTAPPSRMRFGGLRDTSGIEAADTKDYEAMMTFIYGPNWKTAQTYGSTRGAGGGGGDSLGIRK